MCGKVAQAATGALLANTGATAVGASGAPPTGAGWLAALTNVVAVVVLDASAVQTALLVAVEASPARVTDTVTRVHGDLDTVSALLLAELAHPPAHTVAALGHAALYRCASTAAVALNIPAKRQAIRLAAANALPARVARACLGCNVAETVARAAEPVDTRASLGLALGAEPSQIHATGICVANASSVTALAVAVTLHVAVLAGVARIAGAVC